jgi:hypothetical protein
MAGQGKDVGSESDTDKIHMVMLSLLFVAFQYIAQVQQSELVIERVLLDRSQTRLKEFLNNSTDPTIVCTASEQVLDPSKPEQNLEILPL